MRITRPGFGMDRDTRGTIVISREQALRQAVESHTNATFVKKREISYLLRILPVPAKELISHADGSCHTLGDSWFLENKLRP